MDLLVTDTHVHLDRFPRESVPGILRRALAAGVQRMVTVGVDLETSERAVELSWTHEPVLAAVGFHPSHLEANPDTSALRQLRRLASGPGVVAVGEIGLDTVSSRASLGTQRAAFRSQLRLAREMALPVMLHVRGAFDELFSDLDEERWIVGAGVVHYFQGDERLGRRCVERGLFVSFGRPLLRSADLAAVAEKLPLDSLLIETDAFPREPQRWTEPAAVRPVMEALARIKRIETEALAAVLEENWQRLAGAWRGSGS